MRQEIMCANRNWTRTGKSKKLNGLAGMNFVPVVITQFEMTCDKCGYTTWADDGLVMCTQKTRERR